MLHNISKKTEYFVLLTSPLQATAKVEFTPAFERSKARKQQSKSANKIIKWLAKAVLYTSQDKVSIK
jgi:hypothetical protein